MSSSNAKNPELFVDNDPYQWSEKTITGAQIRSLAAVPAGVLIFQKIPSKPDKPIEDDTVIDLTPHGPERFSTQAVGSQAG
jgi:hypothetical protein